MSNNYFIEDCFSLTPKDVMRSLMRVRRIGTKMDDRRSDIDYHFDDIIDQTTLITSVADSPPQTIPWEWVPNNYGYVPFFKCPECVQRRRKLYLPPGSHEFKCRKCYQLHYELSHINKKSAHGRLLYKTNRIIRLANQRANMKRIIHKKKFTKRFQSFLNSCRQVGLYNVVLDAERLLAAVRSQ